MAENKIADMKLKLEEAKVTMAELQDKVRGHTVQDLMSMIKKEKKRHEKEVRLLALPTVFFLFSAFSRLPVLLSSVFISPLSIHHCPHVPPIAW